MTLRNERALNHFFRLLRQTRGWHLSHDGCIRQYSRSGATFCPITGVCRLATRRVFTVGEWEYAAKPLKLRWRTAWYLVQAADGKEHSRVTRRYRKLLLEATGLE